LPEGLGVTEVGIRYLKAMNGKSGEQQQLEKEL
jgi:hypothetical protein